MAEVTNPTDEVLQSPLYDLTFPAGATVEVADDIAATLGSPLVVSASPAPVPPAEPAPVVEPAPETGGN